MLHQNMGHYTHTYFGLLNMLAIWNTVCHISGGNVCDHDKTKFSDPIVPVSLFCYRGGIPGDSGRKGFTRDSPYKRVRR